MPGDDILHAIYERLGGIDAKLESGSQRHAEFAQTLAELEQKTDTLTERVGKVEALAARVSIIEPTLWELEGKRQQKLGQKKLIGGVFKASHAGWVLVVGFFTWAATHLTWWPWK